MGRLEDISMEQLRAGLDEVDDPTATLRLVVGINYKAGVPQSEIATWYGVSRTTVHNWLARLERLESEPLEAVVYDVERPGRPPKLAPDEREQLTALLQEPPSALGLDAQTWSPGLVRDLIREIFDVEYSTRHVRDLLSDADVDWRRRKADPSETRNLSDVSLREPLRSEGS